MNDEVERETVVPATPEEAWKAVVESDWLGEIDPTPGGQVEGGDRSGFVEDAEAPSRLIFWWGADPEALYSLYHSSQIAKGFNWSHYTSADVDKLLEQGYIESDVTKRLDLYKQAQVLIMNDAPTLEERSSTCSIVSGPHAFRSRL